MDLNLLYETRDGVALCKLCGAPPNHHEMECPGVLLECGRILINVYGRHCTRGCCGSTDEYVEVESSDWPKAIDAAIRAGSECVDPGFVFVFKADIELPVRHRQIHDRIREMKEQQEERRRQEEREEQERKHVAMLEGLRAQLEFLEDEREDLKPEAYDRRRAEIEAEIETAKGGP